MSIFKLRENAIEGQIFYNNTLTCEHNVKKYFPPITGEMGHEYKKRPKLSAPITRSIIDRVVGFVNKGANIDPRIQDILKHALITGTCAAVLKYDSLGNVVIEPWTAEYLLIEPNALMLEWEEEEKGEISPVTDEDDREEDYYKSMLIDDIVFGGIRHNLPFAPYSLLRAPDLDYDNIGFGSPFFDRFKMLVIEYNQILSKMSKDIRILSNVWVTNKNFDNQDNPIRLDSGVVNFLGENGTLEQAIKNLNLTEEKDFLKILKENISEAAQVPSQLIGLDSVGNIPSGVALQLLFQPLAELVARIRPAYKAFAEDVIYKYNYMDMSVGGKAQMDTNITFSNTIIPADKTVEINLLTFAKANSLLTDEEIADKLRGLLDG